MQNSPISKLGSKKTRPESTGCGRPREEDEEVSEAGAAAAAVAAARVEGVDASSRIEEAVQPRSFRSAMLVQLAACVGHRWDCALRFGSAASPDVHRTRTSRALVRMVTQSTASSTVIVQLAWDTHGVLRNRLDRAAHPLKRTRFSQTLS